MRVGLDRLFADDAALSHLRSRRVGLLCHPASVDRNLVHMLDGLLHRGVDPVLLFGPEHGVTGHAQDMIPVEHNPEHGSKRRVVSLYGETFARLSPTAQELAAIDLLLIDLQDVGSRYYTFVWTALLALRACHRAGVDVWLLDRPNPIDGVTLEGALPREERLLSFVGLAPVPVRHACTLGEIVAQRARVEGLTDALTVFPVDDWDRSTYADAWDRPFVMPSPNMPTVETAVVYPGGCLLEATNLSEGRGTTRPFELVGAPWLDGERLARALATSGLPGFVARPLVFRPAFHKHFDRPCGGVQIHVVDRRCFRPLATYLALLTLARAQQPEAFALRTQTYEYVEPETAPALDLLTGTTATREALLGGADVATVIATMC